MVDKVFILKSIGVLIALDNFGLESSNLLPLSKITTDIAKLDYL